MIRLNLKKLSLSQVSLYPEMLKTHARNCDVATLPKYLERKYISTSKFLGKNTGSRFFPSLLSSCWTSAFKFENSFFRTIPVRPLSNLKYLDKKGNWHFVDVFIWTFSSIFLNHPTTPKTALLSQYNEQNIAEWNKSWKYIKLRENLYLRKTKKLLTSKTFIFIYLSKYCLYDVVPTTTTHTALSLKHVHDITVSWREGYFMFCFGSIIFISQTWYNNNKNGTNQTGTRLNFINVLCTAFTHVDPKCAKKTVKSAVSFDAFGTYEPKSCTLNVGENEPR